jgi:hypothetical protein
MRPLRIAVWVAGLAVAAAGGGPLHAAWDNVFQVCCHNCQSPPVTSYYADPCCPQPCPPPCPQQVCTTRMVQRSYYQPVTTWETRTEMQQVTTYRTSYYWEPVCTYRVSCYFDPCTCSYRQVSVPVTSHRLRSQCCPVQSWVSRCVSVPVTRQQLVTCYEPQTTCCTVTPPPCPSPAAAPPPAGVNEQRQLPPIQPGVGETRDGNGTSSQKPYDPYGSPMPHAPQSGVRQPAAPAAPPPSVKLDRIVALPRHNVEGEVVRPDTSADGGAFLMFKRVDRQGESQSVTAGRDGRFRATLASGTWDVYTQKADGSLMPQKRIDVRGDQTQQVRLTSR